MYQILSTIRPNDFQSIDLLLQLLAILAELCFKSILIFKHQFQQDQQCYYFIRHTIRYFNITLLISGLGVLHIFKLHRQMRKFRIYLDIYIRVCNKSKIQRVCLFCFIYIIPIIRNQFTTHNAYCEYIIGR